jgi:hypothetical protein
MGTKQEVFTQDKLCQRTWKEFHVSLLFCSAALRVCFISTNEFEVYNICNKISFLKNVGLSCDVENVALIIKISWYFSSYICYYCTVIHHVTLISKFHVTELTDSTF